MLRVFKFGGALLEDVKGIEQAASIINQYKDQQLVVVVSALGKTTNALEEILELMLAGKQEELQAAFDQLKQFHIKAAKAALKNQHEALLAKLDRYFDELWSILGQEPEGRFYAYDQIVGMGEQFSSLIVYHYLKNKGLPMRFVDAHSIVVTNSKYTDASVNWRFTEKTVEARVQPALDENLVVITQGFIGADERGHYTTLGREGSDFTAAILAAVLHADEVTIWKDVPGLMNADPRRFPNSIKLDHISYREAIELAFYGASVIHPKTIQPLQNKNIPLFVHSFYKPEVSPTVIDNDSSYDHEVHSIIVKDHQVLLSIASQSLSFIAEENLGAIFKAFGENNVHINLMQHSAVSFSVCFNYQEATFTALFDQLSKQYKLRYNKGLQLLTIRNYNPKVIEEYVKDRKVYLEQKSRSTYQVLIKA